MNILIVGGAGYIGGVTTHLALEAGHTITVVDDLSSGHAANVPSSVSLIQGDITDAHFVSSLFEDQHFDTIMHFAAKILVAESMAEPYEYYRNNTFGTLEIINQAVAHGVKRYILSSTAATYGDPQHSPLTEDDPTNPVNPYGFSKLMCEQLLRSYELTHGLQWCALRYFNVAGAYDDVGPDYPFVAHVIPKLLDALKKNEPFTIYGSQYDTPDGTCIRDYVHVADVAKAHLLAADKMESGAHLNQPINLGSSSGFSVKEVVKTFLRVTRQHVEITNGPERPGDPAKLVASNQRAKELLDWQPQYTLEQIIADHYQWSVNRPE